MENDGNNVQICQDFKFFLQNFPHVFLSSGATGTSLDGGIVIGILWHMCHCPSHPADTWGVIQHVIQHVIQYVIQYVSQEVEVSVSVLGEMLPALSSLEGATGWVPTLRSKKYYAQRLATKLPI